MNNTQLRNKPYAHASRYEEPALTALNAAAERIEDACLQEQIQRITQRMQHELQLKKARYAEENHDLAGLFSPLEIG